MNLLTDAPDRAISAECRNNAAFEVKCRFRTIPGKEYAKIQVQQLAGQRETPGEEATTSRTSIQFSMYQRHRGRYPSCLSKRLVAQLRGNRDKGCAIKEFFNGPAAILNV